MSYFIAEIHIMTETYNNNDPNEGCDPDSMQDHGLIDTIKKPTKEELKKELDYRYDNIEHYEENRYETGFM